MRVAPLGVMDDDRLPEQTMYRAFDRLGLTASDDCQDIDSLTNIYRKWCRLVPFDNALRFIGLREGTYSVLPGLTTDDFIRTWFRHGCGGMCIPSASALADLLAMRGYTAIPHIAYLDVTDIPNHITVVVTMPEGRYVLDTVGVTGGPVYLGATRYLHGHGARQVEVTPVEATWYVTWRTAINRSPQVCRLGQPVTRSEALRFYSRNAVNEDFRRFHQRLYARIDAATGIFSVAGSHAFITEPDGRVRALGHCAEKVLAHDFGWSAELLARLSRAGAFSNARG
jgi:N-hydroxyarylamine O-acetyltransferase